MKKIAFFLCIMLVALFVLASEVEIPKFTHQYVNDYGELLSQSEEQSINQILKAYQDSTSNQLMVLTIANNDYEAEGTLFDYSQKVFVTWGVGQKGKNNGVLLVVVKNQNPNKTTQIRIVTGYGIEGPLSDVVCKRIIRSSRPLINEGNYYQGINLILGEIITQIDKEFTADKETEKGLPTWAIFLIGVMIVVVIGLIVYALMSTDENGDSSSSSSSNDSSSDNDSNSRRSRRSRDRDDDSSNIFIASSFMSSGDSSSYSSGGDYGGSDSGCDCGGGDGGGGGGGD